MTNSDDFPLRRPGSSSRYESALSITMRPRNLVIFALFLLIAAGVVASQLLFQWSPGSFVNPKPPLSISVLYSAELSSWLGPATDSSTH